MHSHTRSLAIEDDPGKPAGVDAVEVALNLPMDRLFTYAVPDALRAMVRPGVRVRVPFQTRLIGGTCIQFVERPAGIALKPLVGIVEKEPLFSPAMLRVARWIARRYGASLGEALDAALPFAVKSGGKARAIATATLALPREKIEETVAELEAKHPKQARALRILADAGAPLEVRELARQAKVGESPVLSLGRKGFVRLERVSPERTIEFETPVEREGPKEPTPAQAEVLRQVTARIATGRFGEFLLFGVTGSGKTEVYLQALADVVARGRQGIVLVPEIALTPQTVARFRARFDRVAVLHSHLTDAERHTHWKAIQRGEADVVVGARSAIFAPMPRLGLVVIDEEHESTFKQQNVPRYGAREVARVRARLERAVLLLGSATPSLESYHRALTSRSALLCLTERAGAGAFPETIVADLGQTLPAPGKAGFLTDRLRAAIFACVERKEQVILFLNRRGFATGAFCKACGTPVKCRNCDIVLVYHRRIGRVLCHYCGHEERLPAQCGKCAGPFRLAGFGTERVEDEVKRWVPAARVVRMDSDTMKARGAHEKVLSAFRRGEVDVLVGTQMIAKGLDFPNVTLVGVVSADTTLQVPDYRASERTFALLAQVSGRAGRGDKVGTVIVQTHDPDHFAIRLALDHDYEAFARIELEARRQDGYPPFGHLARVVVQGPDLEHVTVEAKRLRDDLGEWIADGSTQLLGPAPAPIELLNGQHRVHIVAKSRLRSGIARFVRVVRTRARPAGKLRLLLDVDPYAML